MARPFLLIAILLLTIAVRGQKTRSLSLELIGRYDKHAHYTTRYFDRTYTNDTKLWGKSFGANILYHQGIFKNFAFSAGLGYYQLRVDKIRQTTRFNIIASGRNIDYQHPSGIEPLFGTNKYHYNNLNFVAGLIYNQPFNSRLEFIAGMDFNYLYSFSQVYNITFDNIRHKTSNGRPLGFTINSSLGVLKRLNNKHFVAPKLLVPIHQQLRGDALFGESNHLQLKKWFNGIGLSLAVGTYF